MSEPDEDEAPSDAARLDAAVGSRSMSDDELDRSTRSSTAATRTDRRHAGGRDSFYDVIE